MNDLTINKFLLGGDCGPFTKCKERMQNFKETGDLRYIYPNESGKACL